ncbi:SAM-dependent DNA methyltransferase [Agromyces sp. NPDC055520]
MTGTMSGSVMAEPRHIKSRERVRDLGEVYTQAREVNAMLDLIPDAFTDIDTRFLEPAAGDGNFLVAILERKISAIDEKKHGGSEHWYEFALLRCLASTYGIDINDENVDEARQRMMVVIDAAHVFRGAPVTEGFARAAEAIIATNVVVGDSLNAADQIVFVEYTPLAEEQFQRVPSELEAPMMDLFYEPPRALPTVHYSELGN